MATQAEALRLASGLVLLGLLPGSFESASSWRLFGSWAILLQSPDITRLPNDVDIELRLDGASTPMVMSDKGEATGSFQLKSSRAHAISFSDPRASPVAFWQIVEVVDGGNVLSEETVNWVFRGSRSNGDADALRARSGTSIDLTECSAFSIALRALPELVNLPLPKIPLASREECIAQKWTRIAMPRSGGRRHTRWQDLADVYDLVLGARATLDGSLFIDWLMQCARERGLEWPCVLPTPPLEWLDFWDSYNFRSGVSRPSPEDCTRELNAYLASA